MGGDEQMNTEQGTRNVEVNAELKTVLTSSFRVPCSVFNILHLEIKKAGLPLEFRPGLP
jgi:hypothetical protein